MTQVIQQLRRIDEVFRGREDVRTFFQWVDSMKDPDGVDLGGYWVLEVSVPAEVAFGNLRADAGVRRVFTVTGESVVDALAQAAQVLT